MSHPSTILPGIAALDAAIAEAGPTASQLRADNAILQEGLRTTGAESARQLDELLKTQRQLKDERAKNAALVQRIHELEAQLVGQQL